MWIHQLADRSEVIRITASLLVTLTHSVIKKSTQNASLKSSHMTIDYYNFPVLFSGNLLIIISLPFPVTSKPASTTSLRKAEDIVEIPCYRESRLNAQTLSSLPTEQQASAPFLEGEPWPITVADKCHNGQKSTYCCQSPYDVPLKLMIKQNV